MELETEGKIERIRKDRKAVSLGFDEWYNSNFKLISEEFKVGDYVKIVFNEKKEDNKIFKNLKSMAKTKQEPIKVTELDIEVKKKEIPNQTENTILMCVKDIIVKSIEQGKSYESDELTYVIKKLTNDFLEAYKILANWILHPLQDPLVW